MSIRDDLKSTGTSIQNWPTLAVLGRVAIAPKGAMAEDWRLIDGRMGDWTGHKGQWTFGFHIINFIKKV
jgi:hypothetical protein